MVELWFDNDDDDSDITPTTEQNTSTLTKAYILFLLTWQTLFRVSDAGMNVLFRFISMVLGLVTLHLQIPKLETFVKLLPLNVTAAKKTVKSNNDTLQVALCVIPYTPLTHARLCNQISLFHH